MKITRAFVPNMFTTLNMFSGFMSIISASQGKFIIAAWFVILAAVFDGLDGVMARITKSSSEFGVEFDSLSDIVSFGVAPSFLVYNIWLYELQNFGILISAFPLIFGGIRLARFNVQLVGFDKDFFRGLPIPSAAGLLITYVLTFYDGEFGLSDFLGKMLIPLIIISSLLMVSMIRYDTLPRPTRESVKENTGKFLILFAALILALATKGKAMFYLFAIYAISGPVRVVVDKILTYLKNGRENGKSKEEAASLDV